VSILSSPYLYLREFLFVSLVVSLLDLVIKSMPLFLYILLLLVLLFSSSLDNLILFFFIGLEIS